jgi:SagB-type dehydrogenase family enzyme
MPARDTPDPGALEGVIAWHRLSSHAPGRFAPGPGGLDWVTQPDPFRHYTGAFRIPLDLADTDHPLANPTLDEACGFPNAPDTLSPLKCLGRLLQDSLGLSAWKEFNGSRWALRMNPSSGNLHPVELHLMGGPLPGVCEQAWVAHYDPLEHALELRAVLPDRLWNRLSADLPSGSLLLGLTVIPWREAWKYGERAFRYVHHDTGHALGALAFAAAPLGLELRVQESLGAEAFRVLFGLENPEAPFAEIPAALVVVCPAGSPPVRLPESVAAEWRDLEWQGQPNPLGALPRNWPGIPRMVEWTAARDVSAPVETVDVPESIDNIPPSTMPVRHLIHRRRSAQAMDGQTGMTRDSFRRLLLRTLPAHDHLPLSLLPGPARVSLLLFVHRVEGIEPGLLMLVRRPEHETALRTACDPGLAWSRETAAGEDLPLFRLASGNWQQRSADVSCGQDIAGDGALSLGMLAEFRPALASRGPSLYPRLYWECGLLGQILYLEAEAAGLSGTGIGCFFDEEVHRCIGLTGDTFRSLYHFTIGGALVDTRLQTIAPYPHPRLRSPG